MHADVGMVLRGCSVNFAVSGVDGRSLSVHPTAHWGHGGLYQVVLQLNPDVSGTQEDEQDLRGGRSAATDTINTVRSSILLKKHCGSIT